MARNLANGQYADEKDIILAPAGTVVTATSNGAIEFDSDRGTARLDLVITAASGTTPNLTVNVQTKKLAADSYATVASFTAATTTGSQRKVFTGLDRLVRLSYTVSGTTPSFTFGVSGELV